MYIHFDMNTIQLAIIIVFVLILLYKTFFIPNLQGMWECSSEFCQNSGLKSMLLFFGDRESLFNGYSGYIIAEDDSGLILNNKITIYMWYIPTFKKYDRWSVTISGLDEDEKKMFPSSQSLYYYPDLGKIVMADDKKVTALFYKNNPASDCDCEMPSSLPVAQNIEDYDEL